jgi:mRNA-degrading endonuclease toxin of MazEF toxin-antitoxin module
VKRGDVILVRFPHPSGVRGKKRPAVVIQSDDYAGSLSTIAVAEITKNVSMKDDPACLFIDMSVQENRATGVLTDSVASCLLPATIDRRAVAQVIGSLPPRLLSRLDDCLKAAFGIR